MENRHVPSNEITSSGDPARALPLTESALPPDPTGVRASQEAINLKAALDAHAIVAFTDVRGRITYVNDRFCAISQYSRDELLGQDHRIINSGHHSPEFFRDLWRTIARGQIWRGELKNRAKDGSFYWVDTTIVPRLNEHGQPREYIAIRADITQRKLAEEALQTSDQEIADLRAALDEHAIVAITDVRGRITFVNDRFCAISQYSREELLGQDHRIINSGHHSREFFRQLWSAIGRGEVWRGEVKNRAKDGSHYWVDTTIVPFLNVYGKPRQFVAIRSDITARKAAEERNANLASIVASSPDAIVSHDTTGTIRTWNQGAETIFGYTAEEMIGASILKLTAEENREEEQQRLDDIRRGAKSRQYEAVRHHRDGHPVHVAVMLSPLKQTDGRIIGVSNVARDVTESKRLEAQFLRAQRMEAIGTLADGVAHDLNNLLAPMLMARPFLEGSITDPHERELLDMIHQTAHRAAGIVRQLLTFSRGEEGERRPVEVSQLYSEIESFMRETFPRNIRIEVEHDQDLWPILGNATQVHQVLMNLCINARDAMAKGGKLILNARNLQLDAIEAGINPKARPGHYVLLSVRDNGTGIPSALQEKIFDPFFTTKPLSHGTGLGLSTVAGIVKSHGGFIKVYSETGVGTCFSVYLPAAESGRIANPKHAPRPLIGGHRELVLIVDDEEPIKLSLSHLLTRHNYRVITAANGREGLERFSEKQDEIQLVITDTIMPEMSGLDMVKDIRAMAPRLPIVATTGLGLEIKRQAYEAIGVNDVLFKPCEAAELLTVVHQHLHAPPAN